MAYAAVVTRDVVTISGRRQWIITVAETEAKDTSEFEIPNLPKIGTIKLYHATLTAGTGTTINPTIGRASGFSTSTQDHVATSTLTAADVNDSTDLVFRTGTGSLWIRSTVNDGTADHEINTTILIQEGVQS